MTGRRRHGARTTADLARAVITLAAVLEETNNQIALLRQEMQAQRVYEYVPAPGVQEAAQR